DSFRGPRFARPCKLRPGRLDQPYLDAAGDERLARRDGIADAIEAKQSKAATLRARPERSHALAAGAQRPARLGRKAVEGQRHHAAARSAAVLDARDHLLSDETALVEVDAPQLVHVALMRKSIAVSEVEAAARHPERDAMGLVGRRVDELGAQVGYRLAG